MRKFKIVTILASMALVLGFALPGAAVARDHDDDNEPTKINICHATDSVKNPWEALNTSADHSGHLLDYAYAGPVKDDGKPTKDGDAWCEANVPKPVVPGAVTSVAPTCTVSGSYTVPTTAGVEYKIGDAVVAAGTYTAANGTSVTVTAHALAGGYFFEEGTTASWTLTFTAATNCGSVLGTQTTVTPTTVAQVTVKPAGSVSAGAGGGSSSINMPAIFGLLGSFGVLAFGTLRKFNA